MEGGEGTPGTVTTWVQWTINGLGSLLVCLGYWVPMEHSRSSIIDTNLHPLDWPGDLRNDKTIIQIDWDCYTCHLLSNWTRENRCQTHSFLSLLCKAVTTMLSFLPHLIWVTVFSVILGAILPCAHTSWVLARVLLHPVLWKSASILGNSLVSKFIFYPPCSGTLRIKPHVYSPSGLVLKLD